MTGIKEKAHLRGLKSCAEIADHCVERHLVEIEPFDHLKAEFFQRGAHVCGIVLGIIEPWRVLIGRVADDERDAVGRGGEGSALRIEDSRCRGGV